MPQAPHKLRILRVVTRLNIGGPAIHVINLAAGLSRERFETLLVCGTELPGEGSMLERAFQQGVTPLQIPVIVNEFGLKWADAEAIRKLRRLMKEFRPHIVHTHTAKAGFLGRVAARMAGVPRVVHTFHGHVLQGYFDPARTWVLRRMERWLAGRTDRIITVSERVRQELVQYGVAPLKKISTVPLGFDLAPFLESASLRGTLRRELGVNPGALLVGIVGRIFPIKNHPLFLEAAARVTRAIPEAEFVVVGDGPLRADLERRAAAADLIGRVHFLSWRKDLPAIYADLDLLVVSSDNEGTPVAAIEAMASRCVVVATRVGGLPDLLEHEATGFLVPPRDADALAGAIVRALRDPALAQRVRDNALLVVRQRFDVRRLIKDMEALYEDLWIQPSPPAPDS